MESRSLSVNTSQLALVSGSYLLGSRGNLLDAGHGCLLLDDLREFCNLGQKEKSQTQRPNQCVHKKRFLTLLLTL